MCSGGVVVLGWGVGVGRGGSDVLRWKRLSPDDDAAAAAAPCRCSPAPHPTPPYTHSPAPTPSPPPPPTTHHPPPRSASITRSPASRTTRASPCASVRHSVRGREWVRVGGWRGGGGGAGAGAWGVSSRRWGRDTPPPEPPCRSPYCCCLLTLLPMCASVRLWGCRHPHLRLRPGEPQPGGAAAHTAQVGWGGARGAQGAGCCCCCCGGGLCAVSPSGVLPNHTTTACLPVRHLPPAATCLPAWALHTHTACRVYNDGEGREHVQLQFHLKGPAGRATVNAGGRGGGGAGGWRAGLWGTKW